MGFSVIILLSLVSSSVSPFDYSSRCLLYLKNCVRNCPRMMHPYHPRCDGETLSQRTCYSPNVYTLGFTCGWSRCDCNGDKVLNELNGLCISLNVCPKQLPRKYTLRKKPEDILRQPTRHRMREQDPAERVMDGDK